MLFDPANPLLARHLLSGTISQMVTNPPRDKRMRTTITPEQLEVLYQKYLLDSNPTRKMLDHISSEVGLKKRVVQVWFQNTRARERKACKHIDLSSHQQRLSPKPIKGEGMEDFEMPSVSVYQNPEQSK
uniref:Homeobox domain-containing protein n=1 Tax=Cyprinus carpio TaxID=7962 RepID=A0A8C2FH80_CYPCA